MPPNPAADANDQGDDWYDALDEALMETFPASDPIAVSEPIHRHVAPTLPSPASGGLPGHHHRHRSPPGALIVSPAAQAVERRGAQGPL